MQETDDAEDTATLVNHPYDQIGRKMAIQTKNLFVKQVLMPSHGTKPWEKLGKCFKIPTGVLKYPKLVIMLPMLWATFGTLRKGSVYIYDMHSDVEVIQELGRIPNITAPEIPSQNVTNYFLNNYTESGVFALKNPCEFLDQVEEIGNELVPFYKPFVSNAANAHWNPNRNSEVDLSSFFEALESLMKSLQGNQNTQVTIQGFKPSDFLNMTEDLLDMLKTAQTKLTSFEK